MKAPTDVLDGAARAQQAKASSTTVAKIILKICHSLTFCPLFIIVILQDAHLKLAVVLNTALCICLAVGNCCFYRMGVVKVYPKMLDTFLLVFYGSMIPLVYTQYGWMMYWVNVYHHAGVAVFMWLSILLPCWDNFGMEALRDWLPEQLCGLDITHSTALHISQAWAGALSIMSLAALGPALTGRTNPMFALDITCDYVLGLVPLLAAAALHCWILTRGMAAAKQLQEQQQDTELGLSAFPSLAPARQLASGSHSSSGSGSSRNSDMPDDGSSGDARAEVKARSTLDKLVGILKASGKGKDVPAADADGAGDRQRPVLNMAADSTGAAREPSAAAGQARHPA